MTILSVNKTRENSERLSEVLGIQMGALRSFFVFMGADCVHFSVLGVFTMKKSTKYLVQAAIIGALYAVLTHLQNLLLPGSATWAIQMRLSEALCVLAFFTPAAVPGLSIGCLLFNITFAAALPLDFVVGTAATFLAAEGMWLTRKVTVKGYPLLGMLLPAIANAVLVGWELTVYIGGGFAINAIYVAIGEAVVRLVLGTALYYALKKRGFDKRLFAY